MKNETSVIGSCVKTANRTSPMARIPYSGFSGHAYESTCPGAKPRDYRRCDLIGCVFLDVMPGIRQDNDLGPRKVGLPTIDHGVAAKSRVLHTPDQKHGLVAEHMRSLLGEPLEPGPRTQDLAREFGNPSTRGRRGLRATIVLHLRRSERVIDPARDNGFDEQVPLQDGPL